MTALAQVTPPFEGLQDERFIGFNDAALSGILVPSAGLHKAVSPQEGGVLVHAALLGRLLKRQAVDQRLRDGLPALSLVQLGQGATRQGVAGAFRQARHRPRRSPQPQPREAN